MLVKKKGGVLVLFRVHSVVAFAGLDRDFENTWHFRLDRFQSEDSFSQWCIALRTCGISSWQLHLSVMVFKKKSQGIH